MKKQEKIQVYTLKEPQTIAYNPSYEAFFEIEGPQTEEEQCFSALYPALPDAGSIFYKMQDVPDALCTYKDVSNGYQATIKFTKSNWDQVADILFPDKKSIYQAYIDYIKGDIVTITAYAD